MWTNRLINLFRGGRLDAEIDEELRFHTEARIRDNLAAGMMPEEARRDAMRRFGFNLTFRDASGVARFPVQGRELGESRVVIRLYESEDHFTRRLVIPDIRLSDWVTD